MVVLYGRPTIRWFGYWIPHYHMGKVQRFFFFHEKRQDSIFISNVQSDAQDYPAVGEMSSSITILRKAPWIASVALRWSSSASRAQDSHLLKGSLAVASSSRGKPVRRSPQATRMKSSGFAPPFGASSGNLALFSLLRVRGGVGWFGGGLTGTLLAQVGRVQV